MGERPIRRWGRRPRRAVLGGVGAVAALGLAFAGCDSPIGGGNGAGGAMPLVFGSQANITLMSLDGKTRRALSAVPGGAMARDPAWSPDGKQIVFAYSPPVPAVRGPGGMVPLPSSELHLINADGSGARVLVPGAGPGVTMDGPVWAPDGTALYVTYVEITMSGNTVTDGTVEVARLPLSGGPGALRFAGPRQTIVRDAMAPALSPDGQRLACVSTRAGASDGQALLLAGADGSNVGQPLPARLDGFNAPRFSPDGSRLVFARVSPSLPVATVTPFPGRATPGAPTPGAPTPEAPAPVGQGGAGRLPGWLSLLAPRRARAHGTPMDLYVCGADGGDLRRLTELGEDDPSPAWAPDGRRIAFIAEGGVYLVDAGGGDVTHLTHAGGHSRIDWRR